MNKELQFKKIFITGGAGYVGSLLVPVLLNKGHEVVVYDLGTYEYIFQPHERLVQIMGDIRDGKKLIDSSKGCDAFIHLASISNDPSFDLNPDLARSINYDAFDNIIDACNINSIKRLLVASSTSQYGIKPIDEDVTEDTVPEPITDYAKYKYLCEKKLISEERSFEYVFVRPATLCGYAPRLRLDLSINILTMNALVNNNIRVFGGDQIRPALNIRDMVRFYEFMLDAPSDIVNRQAFNVSYKNNTISELANLVKQTLSDREIEITVEPSDDQRSYHVNTDKLASINFTCKYSFEEAIESIRFAFEQGLLVDPLNNEIYHNVKRMMNLKLK